MRILGQTLLLGLFVVLSSCFGGSSGKGGPGAQNFGLKLCSLGCQQGTCVVNEIATNQDIILTFNDIVDRATVSFTTISVVEITSGATPPGEFIVQGARVIFRPTLIESATGVSFGYQDGGEYEFRMAAAPESNVVRSRSQRPNTTPLSCIITTRGVKDLVPGRPAVVFTPSAANPPATNSFVISMVFNDLMQKAQLVDSLTGTSPTIGVSVVDQTLPGGQPVVIPIPGTFELEFNQNKLTTTVTFTALAPYPGGKDGQRSLRLTFAPQIADLAGNPLSNSGSYTVPLANVAGFPGSFAEDFIDLAQLDATASADGLWAAPLGALDSGLDPASGTHKGGGHGLFGVFEPTADFLFDTDSMTMLDFSGRTVVVTGGAFAFERIHIPAGVRVSALGANPLRLYCRGEAVIEGELDLSGEDALVNFGKYFDRDGEVVPNESTANIFNFEATGGEPGVGVAGGATGGFGGSTWYFVTSAGGTAYYDTQKSNYVSGSPDPLRFVDKIRSAVVLGNNGGRVGGAAPLGKPITAPAAIPTDRDKGSGMGSWAWPVYSNSVPDPANPQVGLPRIKSHDTGGGVFLNFSLHRATGGGGGGFWTDGGDGTAFDATSSDPLGNPLTPPVSNTVTKIFEYNSFLNWDEFGAALVPDGAGGRYLHPPGSETLDPAQGLLLGGSGGGGAGSGMHGSWDDGPDGAIDTFRTGDGGGGGGGGGALQIHCGGRLSISGAVSVAGGRGGSSTFMETVPYPDLGAIVIGPPGDAGGGGGSAGSVLFEISGALQIENESLHLEGGAGGLGSAGNHGGAGGCGPIRFETKLGTQTLAQLQALVNPDEAVDLAPIGQPGVANVVQHRAAIADLDFDQRPGGGFFNGNASGAQSLWYSAANNVMLTSFSGYTVTVEYFDGAATQQIVYDGTTLWTVPGATPIWIAFQTGWGPPGASEPDPLSIGNWIVPGHNTASGGIEELHATYARMARFLVVFDQDLIQALIGGAPGAYLRVLELELHWEGE